VLVAEAKHRWRYRRPSWAKLGLIALVVIALTALWRYTPLSNFVRPHKMLEYAHIARATPWAPFALAAAYVPAAFLMFPRPLLSLTAIVAFGLWIGGACILAGVMLAALATYFLGRLMPRGAVRRIAGSKFESFTALLREHAVMAVFAANMLPTPPFAVQGIMAGAIRLNLWEYSAGTLLSLTPGLVAVLIFGHQVTRALEDPSKVSYVALGCAGVGVAIVMFLATRWLARQASGSTRLTERPAARPGTRAALADRPASGRTDRSRSSAQAAGRFARTTSRKRR
jgi:phospholipase D1/2